MYNVVQSHVENLYVDIGAKRVKLCLRLGEQSFFFMVLVIVLNRLLGEVGVGVRDFEALPLNFPFPVCLHFLTPFPFIFYPIIEPVQFTAMFC